MFHYHWINISQRVIGYVIFLRALWDQRVIYSLLWWWAFWANSSSLRKRTYNKYGILISCIWSLKNPNKTVNDDEASKAQAGNSWDIDHFVGQYVDIFIFNWFSPTFCSPLPRIFLLYNDKILLEISKFKKCVCAKSPVWFVYGKLNILNEISFTAVTTLSCM